jgi:hypothetical protein
MDEYFPVTNLAGISGSGNGFGDPVGFTIPHNHFHPCFGQQTHFIRFTPHLLFQTLLIAMAFDLGNHDAMVTNKFQSLAYIANFSRSHNCFYSFHFNHLYF